PVEQQREGAVAGRVLDRIANGDRQPPARPHHRIISVSAFGLSSKNIRPNWLTTAVEAVFVGKERQYNCRFLQMCSHYLVHPVACTPASGWEKGQVENQVGLVRERFFTPRLR